MLFDNTDFDYAISFLSIPGSDFTKETRVDKFLTPEEGFLKGNLEKNEYVLADSSYRWYLSICD